jgi:hypothetical protein
MAVGGQLHASAALTPGKGHGTDCKGGWTGCPVAIRCIIYAVPGHTH